MISGFTAGSAAAWRRVVAEFMRDVPLLKALSSDVVACVYVCIWGDRVIKTSRAPAYPEGRLRGLKTPTESSKNRQPMVDLLLGDIKLCG